MRMTFEIDSACNAVDTIRHEIQTWLHFHGARGTWRITEEDDFDDRKLLTVHFNDSLDAMDFWHPRHLPPRPPRWIAISDPVMSSGIALVRSW